MPPPGSIWANGRGVSRSGPAVSVQWIVRSAAPTRTGTRAILRVLHMVTICHLSSDCRGRHRDGLDSERMQGGCHDADATPAMVHMDVDAVFFASGKRGRPQTSPTSWSTRRWER